MYELPTDKYYAAKPFLNYIANEMVFAPSVVEKKQIGVILVDDISAPEVCLILHYSGFAFLSGRTDNEVFNAELMDFLMNQQNSRPANYRLIAGSDKWNDKFKAISEDNSIMRTRIKFSLNKDEFAQLSGKLKIPEGLTIKSIGDELYKNIKGNIVPGFSWDSSEAFLNNGFGYCLVDGNTILSTSFSAFVSNDRIDIGIETSPEYRGRGYGQITAAAMIESCLRKGLEPIWCCRQDNVNSFSLAKKLGFEDTLYVPIYFPA